MMFVELRRLGEPPGRADADLKRLPARAPASAPTCPAATCTFCSRSACDDFARGEAAAREPVGIEPQPHRVACARRRLTTSPTPGDALDLVADEAVDVVADEQRVVLAVLGISRRRRARSCSRPWSPRCRPASPRSAGALRPARCGSARRRRRCRGCASMSNVTMIGAGAVVAAGRGHVLHPLDAVDRLLERLGHGGFDGLGVGAVVERRSPAPAAARARETARSAASGSRSRPRG